MRAKQTVSLTAVLAAALTAPAARAQTTAADRQERDALAACDSGQTQKGIEVLGRLYAETLEPTYLYNQGRCYQKAALAKEALGRFNEFLRVAKNPDDDLVKRAKGYVADLEAQIAARPPPPTTGRRNTLRTAAFVLGGVGVVGLGAGAFFGLKTMAAERAVNDRVAGSNEVSAADLKADLEDGSRYQTLQFVGYAVGLAALAAGVTVYVLAGGAADRSENVTFAPVLAPGIAALSLGGRF